MRAVPATLEAGTGAGAAENPFELGFAEVVDIKSGTLYGTGRTQNSGGRTQRGASTRAKPRSSRRTSRHVLGRYVDP